jgi:hypothetical protein
VENAATAQRQGLKPLTNTTSFVVPEGTTRKSSEGLSNSRQYFLNGKKKA